jgi:hypothetical protein
MRMVGVSGTAAFGFRSNDPRGTTDLKRPRVERWLSAGRSAPVAATALPRIGPAQAA